MSHRRKPEHTVRISHIRPKSVLNRSGMGGFTLNPYVGCPVGCAYCYVPHMAHNQLEQRPWGSYVDVKEGAAELLEKRLSRMRQPATVFMSTATDPYQPAEEKFRVTRSMLEVFARHPQHSLFILTKQPLVERDADLLARLPRAGVGMSISSIDDRVAQLIEPWAPVTSERLAVIRRLSDAGIATYVLWAPALVPVPLSESFIGEALDAIERSGARALSLDALNYRSSQSQGLTRRLIREGHAPATPDQVRRIERAARERGLPSRIDILESAPVEEMEPLLPF